MQIKFQNNDNGAEDIFECQHVHHQVVEGKYDRNFVFEMDHGVYKTLDGSTNYVIYIQNNNGKTIDTLIWQPNPSPESPESKPMIP